MTLRIPIVLAAASVAVALLPPVAAHADRSSLYRGPGPRPGPDALYAPPAKAPQLTNRRPWRAQPILVSGASAYRRGEFLYQDFLYDDHGARAPLSDPGDPRRQPGGDPTGGDVFSMPNGTYTYPEGADYAGNAADLVELRVKPLRRATAFRLTLNTLKDAELVASTIAIGSSLEPRPVPYGANASAPAQMFLTVHGDRADLRDAADGKVVGRPDVRVDARRRQIEIRIPHADWNPGRRKVRLAAATGLWDRANDRYLLPTAGADATRPGGAAGLSRPTAFFNVAFRFGEPNPDTTDLLGTAADPKWWRDADQGAQLARNDLSDFGVLVDFAKLRRGVSDDMPGRAQGVPQTGPIDRILASPQETAQGTDYSVGCASASSCKGELVGRLQPYAIYVPPKRPVSGRYGLTLLLHSLSANYNQYLGSRNQSQFGDRAPGSIVITPEGRGPDGWYYDQAGADTFEVWADVARRYRLDAALTAITGYSMGGYGTYKLATRYPDLFAKAQPTVGPPGLGVWLPPLEPSGGEQTNTNRMLASLRNIPFLMWVEATDELVPILGTQTQASTFAALGYRYVFDVFAPGEHLGLALNDQYAPAAAFLGETRVERNPAHVTYVVNPTMDFPDVGTVGDHAYWLSGLRLRDRGGQAPLGTADVRSRGFGVGDPRPGGTRLGGGLLTGGDLPALAFTRQSQAWGPVPAEPASDALQIRAENIARMTIDPRRAKVSCSTRLDVSTDGPLSVTLAGCRRTERFGG